MRNQVRCLVFALSILVFWPSVALLVEGQSANVEISGKVLPPRGMSSLPPGTEVTLDNGWGYSRTQIVSNGRFTFSNVPLDRYNLTIRAEGFKLSEQAIDAESYGGSRLHVETHLEALQAREDRPPAGDSTVPLAALRVSKAARREFDKGRADYGKGKLESALRHFEAASSICPDWAQPYAASGSLQVEMKRPLGAETALRRAIALDPGWYVPRKHLGCLLLTTGRSEEALENLDQARRLHPGDAPTCSYRGEALWQMGRHAEALEAFKKALELDQEDAHAGYRLGYVLLQLGRRNEALAAFEMFLRKHPTADTGQVRQIVTELRAAVGNPIKPD